ncbi:MAG: aldo/keto reductase [Bacteroidota bacterium]|nr:MAG: aldo/keto reductase [Bacteroidota bacterium]
MHNTYSRRKFIQSSLASLAYGALFIQGQRLNAYEMPTRMLGNTGEYVSIIGIGGWHIGYNLTAAQSANIQHEAINNGINFFDNCWDYNDGVSEEFMGKALSVNGYRNKVFLMTKVCARDYQGAKKHLEDSLRRLKTDHIDLWQFHAIKWDDDPDLIFDEKNGALKAALEAKKEGKIRFIGFTGHQHPKFHLAMLKKDFEWNTIQFPTNMLDFHYTSFQKEVLPLAYERNIGIIGMKGLAAQDGIIPRELGISAELCRRYALSLPVSTLVCGIGSTKDLWQDIHIAKNFQPLTQSEIDELNLKAAEKGKDGLMEEYKVGNYGCDWHHKHLNEKS